MIDLKEFDTFRCNKGHETQDKLESGFQVDCTDNISGSCERGLFFQPQVKVICLKKKKTCVFPDL